MGLPFAVPTKYLSWVELFLIYILVPRSSFFGHLCGILAGTLCNIPHHSLPTCPCLLNECILLDSSGYLEGIFQTVEGMLPFEGGDPHQPPAATTAGNQQQQQQQGWASRWGATQRGAEFYPQPMQHHPRRRVIRDGGKSLFLFAQKKAYQLLFYSYLLWMSPDSPEISPYVYIKKLTGCCMLFLLPLAFMIDMFSLLVYCLTLGCCFQYRPGLWARGWSRMEDV